MYMTSKRSLLVGLVAIGLLFFAGLFVTPTVAAQDLETSFRREQRKTRSGATEQEEGGLYGRSSKARFEPPAIAGKHSESRRAPGVNRVARATPQKPTVSEVFAAWTGADPSLKQLILRDLLMRGEESIHAARSRLRLVESRDEAYLAIELLARLCGVDCTGDLLDAATSSEDDAVRAASLQALAAIEAPGAPEMVAPFLTEDEEPGVIVAALTVVGRMGTPHHLPLVAPWLAHSDPEIRLLAQFVNAVLQDTGAAGLHPLLRRMIQEGQQGPLSPQSAASLSLSSDFVDECRRVLEEAGGWTLAQHYSDGNKHLIALSLGYRTVTVQLLLDLDDLLGLSVEGQNGWVTYWIDVKTSFDVSVSIYEAIFGKKLPVGLSLPVHEREPGVDDPLRRLHFTAISGTFGVLEVKAGDVGFGGTEIFTIGTTDLSNDIVSGSFLSTSATVLKGEIGRVELKGIVGDALAEESGGVSWIQLAEQVIARIVTPLGFFHHFGVVLNPLKHRPFTSSDAPPEPETGSPRALTISEVRAGLDADDDGYADGYVPPSGSGTNPTTLWNLDVFFFSNNLVQDDFRIRAGELPDGWVIAARGANDQRFGHVYDVYNGVPNTLYGTEWYIGCTPSAPQTIGVDFDLLERHTLFPDKLLDTVTAAFTCESPPPPPSSSTGFTLTLEKVGASSDGSITSDPAVVSCDSDCIQTSATVSFGTEVVLSASPNAGTVFSGWGGACSGTGICTLTMTENHEVTASFNPSTVATTSPIAPSNLQATAASTHGIDLTWKDLSSGEDGFKIQRRDGPNGNWFQIKTLKPNVTTFTNVSLVPDTTYSYRVYAFNEGGDSAYSDIASATTFSDAPNAPSRLRAWAVSTSKIALSWDDPNSGSAAYEIEESADGSTWSVVGYNGTGDTTFTRGVNPLSTRFFRVRAFRSGSGYSGYSSSITVTACAPPHDPRLEDPYSGEDEVPLDRLLEWDGSDEVSTWDLYMGTSDPPPLFAQDIGNPSPGDNILFDPGDFSAGMTYYWKVVAHAACNPTLTSSSAVRFFSTLGAPDPVQLLKPAKSSMDQPTGLVLDWENVSSDGSTVYDLYFDTSNPPQFFEYMHTRTEKLMESLSPETTYYWQVVAKAADDLSLTSSSPVWEFTTGASSTVTIHLPAIEDAGLRGGGFGDRNYGGDPDGAAEQKAFGVGNDDNFYLNDGPGALRGALKFDLSSIPIGSNIVNATLTLQYAGGSGSQSSALDMFFVPYSTSWSEGSITWNNRPSGDTSHQVQGTFPLSGFNPTQNDLTPLVQKWVGGTIANHGFEVSIPAWESESSKAKYFYQKEWSASLVADLQVTYGEPCSAPPAPSSPSPAPGATGQPSPLTLDWADSTGAASYDVYFGESATPPLQGLRASSDVEVTHLAPGTTYHWRVEARAGCDTSLTSSSPTWAFTTSSCLDLATPTLTSPAHQAIGEPRQVTLTWDAVTGAGDYEVYFGTSNPPTFLLTTTAETSAPATVQPGTTYFWQVKAIASCDASRTSTSGVHVFETASAPLADAGPDQVVPEGTSSVIGGSPSASGGVGPYSYSWSVSPESGAILSSATPANPTLTVNVPDNYVVQLVVTDANGFSSLPGQALIEGPCSNQDVVLTGETIAGPTLFEACRTLTMASSVVEGSGELTLRAGQKVILGDGFQVQKGGSLTVEVDPSLTP